MPGAAAGKAYPPGGRGYPAAAAIRNDVDWWLAMAMPLYFDLDLDPVQYDAAVDWCDNRPADSHQWQLYGLDGGEWPRRCACRQCGIPGVMASANPPLMPTPLCRFRGRPGVSLRCDCLLHLAVISLPPIESWIPPDYAAAA